MSFEFLGEGFDLHGGGQDLKFPAQRERASPGRRRRASVCSRQWTHKGMVVAKGEKMSKSIGNFRAWASCSPNTTPVRTASSSFNPTTGRRSRCTRAESSPPSEPSSASTHSPGVSVKPARPAGRTPTVVSAEEAERLISSFRDRMDDDLGTPEATAVLFEGLTAANTALERHDTDLGGALGRAVLSGFASVGLLPSLGGDVSEDALELARRRDEARADRDYAAADRLRDEIVSLGYRVEDTPTGTRVFR